MSEHHDHRDDCPFKFATLDVCDCVEKNMLDRIEALTAENKRLGQQCEGLMQAGMNNGQALIIAEAKLAKAVEALEVIRDRQYYRMGPGVTAQVIARATLAVIKGESRD